MRGSQEAQKRGYPGGVLKDGLKSAIVCFFMRAHVIMFICALGYVCVCTCV